MAEGFQPISREVQDYLAARARDAGHAPSETKSASKGESDSQNLESLLTQAEQALASVNDPLESGQPPVTRFELNEFTGTPDAAEAATLDLVRDVELDLKIELGRTQMYLEDVLKLRGGSVVPLDRMAGDLVDIVVNGRLIARGEVLVLNENFCVRVVELLADGRTALR